MDIKRETLTVYDRERMNLNGVLNIEAFDEEYVLLALEGGNVCVEGQSLKITSLTGQAGEIIITGSIKSIAFYEQNEGKRKRGRGIFK